MKNFEKYKDYLVKAIAVCNSDELMKLAGIEYKMEYHAIKKSLVDWLLQEYKEPILDKTEKEYLEGIIKPFRKNVKYISKIGREFYKNEYFIKITVESYNPYEFICLPYFNSKSGMYAGMESFRKYTPKELGLL